MASVVDLRPKRELINPNFDHYQLTLDKIPKHEVVLDRNVDVAKPPELSFSSHHAKLYSIHNPLFLDPWDPLTVYYCDKEWTIHKISVSSSSGLLGGMQLSKPELVDSVFQVPNAANLRLKPARFNVGLGFLSETLSVIVNGSDSFYLLDTQNRNTNGKWSVLFQGCLPMSGQAHQLVDCSHWKDGENDRVAILVATVEELEGERKEMHGSPFITILSWITLLSVDGKSWSVERKRRLESSRPFECACLEHDGSAIQVVSPKMYKLTEDSVKPVENSESWEMVAGEAPAMSLYTWHQTSSELTVHLTIPEGLTKANMCVTISGSRLEVSVKNDIDMIKGDLHARVEVDSSTWTLEGRRLEIMLQKVEEEMWPTVIRGDTRGELVMSEDQVNAIHERLAHLTADHWNANPDKDNKPYNCQMLEDCDAVDGDGVILARIDGELHKATHKALTSNQYLFSVRLKPQAPLAVCLRHDVDGFIWQSLSQVKSELCPWDHVGVLNAFGYVLASKQQRRFCSCSQDMSTAVIADAQRHVYLYRQRVSVLSPVRNRKTGTQITSVAKQQVISLDCSPDIILGMQITNTKLFILTEQKLLVYALETEELV